VLNGKLRDCRGSVYRFIGVWQQDIAKDHSERTVHMSSLIPHAPSL